MRWPARLRPNAIGYDANVARIQVNPKGVFASGVGLCTGVCIAIPRLDQITPLPGAGSALHSRAMRIATFIAYSLMIVGVIGAFAAHFFALPKVCVLSVFCIGFGLLIGALESLTIRRMSLRAWDRITAAYDGWPAIIWGVMLAVMAGCFIGAAYAMNAGRWKMFTDYLCSNPRRDLRCTDCCCSVLACGVH